MFFFFLFPQLHQLLNDKIGSAGDDEQPDHDFDAIDHTNCNYADDGKGLQIDVDKILGSAKDEVRPALFALMSCRCCGCCSCSCGCSSSSCCCCCFCRR